MTIKFKSLFKIFNKKIKQICAVWIIVYLAFPAFCISAVTKIVKDVETSEKPKFKWSNKSYLNSTTIKVKEYDPLTSLQATIVNDTVTSNEWTVPENIDLDDDKYYKVIMSHKKSNGNTKEKKTYYLTHSARCIVIDGNQLQPGSNTAADSYKYEHGTELTNKDTLTRTYFAKVDLSGKNKITEMKVWYNANSSTSSYTVNLEKDVTGADVTNTIVMSVSNTFTMTATYGMSSTTSVASGQSTVDHDCQYYVRCELGPNIAIQKIQIYYRHEDIY